MTESSHQFPIISPAQAQALMAEHGSPLYIYDRNSLRQRAITALALSAHYGLAVRYAVKANPHPEIIALFADAGLHFDTSSSYEASHLLSHGIPGASISLSSQQPAHNLDELLESGVHFIATSMHQLELFAAAKTRPNTVGLRINPGMGVGHNNRLTTGGVAASFGLWHEYLPQALAFAAKHTITIDRLHIHVGTDGDPTMWGMVMDIALEIAEQMPEVAVLDIGGGYKIAYSEEDTEADMEQIITCFNDRLKGFAEKTGRQLQLEIEPGRWLVAHAGTLLATVVDCVDTGADGYAFLRVDTGMNDILRPVLYGAQHGIRILNSSTGMKEYIVVGHNCETGDILTPASHDPESLKTRQLNIASIGDIVTIHDVGAYCASMSAKGYNAYPSAKEILI